MTTSAQERQALVIADRMAAAWEALDGAAILALFADDATMQSMMKAPYRGKAEIKAMLDGFFARATAVRMEIITKIARGNVLVLERRDHFTIDGKSGVLPAIGVFEIENGLITSWREYYDWDTYIRQIA
ncbi:MAG: nuclear transport factor 2 family protein [Gammaproteobacteria bacterium]|nr:nuclear transport factor 2 family protein [Gammaproteobacteria bacterium]